MIQPYTLETFQAFLYRINVDQVQDLSWYENDNNFNELVIEVLLDLGIDDVAQQISREQIAQLRRVGTWAYWKRILSAHTSNISFSVDGAKYDMDQLFKNAQVMYKLALQDAQADLPVQIYMSTLSVPDVVISDVPNGMITGYGL